MATKPKAAVVSLFRRMEEEEEISFDTPDTLSGAVSEGQVAPSLDGLRPVWLLIGPNYGGKTTFCRWMAIRDGRSAHPTVLAALDPDKRGLADFFEGVLQPENYDPAQTARFLSDLITFIGTASEEPRAVIDMGGGDTSLATNIDSRGGPRIIEATRSDGLALIGAYFLGPRVDDLSKLHSLESKRFQPQHTVLVLNHGRVDPTIPTSEAFAAIRRHSTFRRAVERGAVVVEMPRLDPELALQIERNRLQFTQARDGKVPQGRKTPILGGLDRAAVRTWMEDRMESAFAPVREWLL